MSIHHDCEPGLAIEEHWVEAGYNLCLTCELPDCPDNAWNQNPKCKRYGLRTGCVGRGLPTHISESIPLPEQLTPAPVNVKHRQCKTCIYQPECRERETVLCEGTASVLIGGVLVTL